MGDLFRQEVLYVIKWLRLVKGVKKIIRLKVFDSRYEPHKEEVIEEAIKDVDVEELNWRRLDLSIRTVQAAAANVKTPRLYSGGDWASICHWMSENGINRLKDRVSDERIEWQRVEMDKLFRKDWIHTPTESNGYTENTENSAASTTWSVAGPSDTILNGTPVREYAGSILLRLYTGATNYIIVLPTNDLDHSARTVVQLKDFVSEYQGIVLKRVDRANRQTNPALLPKPVKVAIIDTGIDQNSFEPNKFKEFYSKGDMYSETQDSPWWLSVDIHGTQMAKLVTAIDPYCKLFIAKVGDHKTDITRSAVTKAILDAIADDVDVISMSFTLEGGDKDIALWEAVKNENSKGIVMVCSTADEGENNSDVWPARYDETISIAACSSTGKAAAMSNTTKAEFFFQGEDIIYESPFLGVSYRDALESRSISDPGSLPPSIERIFGSSVATAIAAGVASLFLACCRLDGLDFHPIQRSDKVKVIFNKK
ncbi:subtilisin-like protein [Stipitochalara longipes BDJ]|nr:subtilisin-like protein [Stipitochalara longipes BDJ]